MKARRHRCSGKTTKATQAHLKHFPARPELANGARVTLRASSDSSEFAGFIPALPSLAPRPLKFNQVRSVEER